MAAVSVSDDDDDTFVGHNSAPTHPQPVIIVHSSLTPEDAILGGVLSRLHKPVLEFAADHTFTGSMLRAFDGHASVLFPSEYTADGVRWTSASLAAVCGPHKTAIVYTRNTEPMEGLESTELLGTSIRLVVVPFEGFDRPRNGHTAEDPADELVRVLSALFRIEERDSALYYGFLASNEGVPVATAIVAANPARDRQRWIDDGTAIVRTSKFFSRRTIRASAIPIKSGARQGQMVVMPGPFNEQMMLVLCASAQLPSVVWITGLSSTGTPYTTVHELIPARPSTAAASIDLGAGWYGYTVFVGHLAPPPPGIDIMSYMTGAADKGEGLHMTRESDRAGRSLPEGMNADDFRRGAEARHNLSRKL